MKTVAVNFNVYQMSDELAQAALDMAREAMKGKYAIYAVIRGNYIEMTKYEYPSKKALNMACKEYRERGFQTKTVSMEAA